MRFRKTWQNNKYVLQIWQNNSWKNTRKNSKEEKQFLFLTGQKQIDENDAKPFAPKSYRDFMLYEKHYINAASNYAKANKPTAYKIAQIYKKLTGKTHKKLKPPALWYKEPIFYMGGHMNFYGSGEQIMWPDYSNIIDYELEIGFVLARPLYNAKAKEAEKAIGGFVVFNDFSARDVQMSEMQSGFGPQKSKHFANAISAEFVTYDEIKDIENLKGEVFINSKKISDVSAMGMRFSLGEALAHVSKYEHLYPGEFFATGTLPMGCGLENGHFLTKGDEIKLSVKNIGSVVNKIA